MYTVYSCQKCHHFFKSWHGGVCPRCGAGHRLDAECVSETFYNVAEP